MKPQNAHPWPAGKTDRYGGLYVRSSEFVILLCDRVLGRDLHPAPPPDSLATSRIYSKLPLMSVQFCVLGSGSAGNASLLMTPDLHVLIDAGFPPDELATRLEGTGASWNSLDAVVLTHTHGDHLQKRCLEHCANHQVQFVCHTQHAATLSRGRYFKQLAQQKLLRMYSDDQPLELFPTLRLQPLRLQHDCPPTFGFRFEIRREGTGSVGTGSVSGPFPKRCLSPSPSDAGDAGTGTESHTAAIRSQSPWLHLAYLADLGTAAGSLAAALADVDVLALEFNHDETWNGPAAGRSS